MDALLAPSKQVESENEDDDDQSAKKYKTEEKNENEYESDNDDQQETEASPFPLLNGNFFMKDNFINQMSKLIGHLPQTPFQQYHQLYQQTQLPFPPTHPLYFYNPYSSTIAWNHFNQQQNSSKLNNTVDTKQSSKSNKQKNKNSTNLYLNTESLSKSESDNLDIEKWKQTFSKIMARSYKNTYYSSNHTTNSNNMPQAPTMPLQSNEKSKTSKHNNKLE
jgi:hypothetical protein